MDYLSQRTGHFDKSYVGYHFFCYFKESSFKNELESTELSLCREYLILVIF
jgi:hypothetical protein